MVKLALATALGAQPVFQARTLTVLVLSRVKVKGLGCPGRRSVGSLPFVV
jgi:hypothetical protein